MYRERNGFGTWFFFADVADRGDAGHVPMTLEWPWKLTCSVGLKGLGTLRCSRAILRGDAQSNKRVCAAGPDP